MHHWRASIVGETMKNKNYKFKYFKNFAAFKPLLQDVYEYITIQLEKKNGDSHDLDHIIRVASISSSLALQLNAAVDVVLLAALFHDVARPLEDETGKCHAELGANAASEFLKRYNNPELVNDVSSAIRSHRFSKKIEPKTLEGKILKDADMLDALGSIGLYRVLSFSIEHNRNFQATHQHFYDKLLHNRMSHRPISLFL